MRRGAVMVCPCSLAEMLSVSQSAVHVRDSIRRAVLERDMLLYEVTFYFILFVIIKLRMWVVGMTGIGSTLGILH